MGTRIERDFLFQSAVYFEGRFLMNMYDVTLAMEVETESIREQNVAMDRIKYFFYECIANSVFVDYTEKRVIEKYLQAELRVCTLPEAPFDQIIALLLLLKSNEITEGRLTVTDIVLKSELSDDVKFTYDIESANNNPYGTKGWWNLPTCAINDLGKSQKKEKVVKLIKNSDWCLPELEWENGRAKSSEILFSVETDKQ